MLAAWFSEYWPGTKWTTLPPAQLIAKARHLSASLGLDVNGWTPHLVASVSKPMAVPNTAGVSPISVRIAFVPKNRRPAAEVGFDSAGLPTYWRAPDHDGSAAKSRVPEKASASAAFQSLAGPQAASYKGPVRSTGEDDNEKDYVWKKPSPAPSKVTDSIKVVTQHSLVKSVERTTNDASSSGDDDDDDSGAPGYWSALGGFFGLLCTVGLLAILSIYVLWLFRKAVNHVFPRRVAIAALILMAVVMLFGADWQQARLVSHHQDLPIFSSLFTAALILCFVAVSRGISANARPKWMSLEQLCRLAPVSKAAGLSIAAGVLFSPLLIAIPFLIAACGLFPHAWVLPQHLEVLYSPAPVLDSLNISSGIYLIGFFGFALPALERAIPYRWLRMLVLLPVGTLFFADQPRVVSGPIAAPLAAGFMTVALFWFVWAHFDMLAVLTLQLAGPLMLSIWMLGHKGGELWPLVSAFAALLLVAYWFYRRGQAVPQGDPLATIPSLTGFRAEREKLQAEFSLARRAQQDMLPPTPHVPGYSLAASCTPSLEVGGDLYDFLKLPDGRVAIGVADVSGKGVPAALYMTLTKGLLASVTKDSTQLIPVVEEVNRHLHGVTRKKVFVTMALGFLDPEKQVLQCVRAGHNPMVWRQTTQDATTLVSPGGLGLGITASKVFAAQLKVAELKLSEGDAVVFYSDGITEAMNADMELFGEERLMRAVERADRLNAADALDSILTEVRAFLGGIHPQDDMTLVVLRVGMGG